MPPCLLLSCIGLLCICGWEWEVNKCNGTFQSLKRTPWNLVCFCVCVFGWFVGEFSIGSSPLVQSVELGSVEKAALNGAGGLCWTTTIWQNIKRLSGKIPVFPASPLYITHWTSPHANLCTKRPTRTHTYFPFLPLHYPNPPSMFVLIDFCGVRSFGTAADRPAIHLEFKECSGRSVPFLFVLYRMTTSSGTLPCQQRGWQGS